MSEHHLDLGPVPGSGDGSPWADGDRWTWCGLIVEHDETRDEIDQCDCQACIDEYDDDPDDDTPLPSMRNGC